MDRKNDKDTTGRQSERLGSETIPDCPKCGNNRQVWKNQITGKLTCHRAFCHTVINDDPNAAARCGAKWR